MFFAIESMIEWMDSLLPRHWGEFAILLLCADPTETAAESHLSLPPTIIVIKTSKNNNKKTKKEEKKVIAL